LVLEKKEPPAVTDGLKGECLMSLPSLAQRQPEVKREDGGALFALEGSQAEGFTVVQNGFLKHFMPLQPRMACIYLAGLMRCYGRCGEQWASNETIAREQGVSVRFVSEAWAYWEELGLIKRVPRYLRSPANPLDYSAQRSAEYKYQTTNLILFTRDVSALPGDTIVDKAEDNRGVNTRSSRGMHKRSSRRSNTPVTPKPISQDANNTEQSSPVRSSPAKSIPYEEVQATLGILAECLDRPVEEIGEVDTSTVTSLIRKYGFPDVRTALVDAKSKVYKQLVKKEKVLAYAEGTLHNRAGERAV
jgi:hypothetical protein